MTSTQPPNNLYIGCNNCYVTMNHKPLIDIYSPHIDERQGFDWGGHSNRTKALALAIFLQEFGKITADFPVHYFDFAAGVLSKLDKDFIIDSKTIRNFVDRRKDHDRPYHPYNDKLDDTFFIYHGDSDTLPKNNPESALLKSQFNMTRTTCKEWIQQWEATRPVYTDFLTGKKRKPEKYPGPNP